MTAFGIVGSLIMTFMLVFWLFKNIMTSAYESAFTFLDVRNYSWECMAKRTRQGTKLRRLSFPRNSASSMSWFFDWVFRSHRRELFCRSHFFRRKFDFNVVTTLRMSKVKRLFVCSLLNLSIKMDFTGFLSLLSLLMNVAGLWATRDEQIIPIFHRSSWASR